MATLFGIKAGTPRVCAHLLGDVLGTTFVRHPGDLSGVAWYVATDEAKAERLVLLPNVAASGGLIDPYAADYSVLLYVDRSARTPEIGHILASSTVFRFMESDDKVRDIVSEVLGVEASAGAAEL